MKKTKSFNLFGDVKGRLEIQFFIFFPSRKYDNKYVQNILLAPMEHCNYFLKLVSLNIKIFKKLVERAKNSLEKEQIQN